MIVFDLRCGRGHVFEAWFGSSADFEAQRGDGRLSCPVCGDGEVAKALMTPAVGGKDREGPPPAAVKEAIGRLAAAQARALAGSQWVGGDFADRARAMHRGTEPHETIHGQATRQEARALSEEGVPIMPLPLPVIPPDRLH